MDNPQSVVVFYLCNLYKNVQKVVSSTNARYILKRATGAFDQKALLHFIFLIYFLYILLSV